VLNLNVWSLEVKVGSVVSSNGDFSFRFETIHINSLKFFNFFLLLNAVLGSSDTHLLTFIRFVKDRLHKLI
jgi:hypothetical protein